MTFMERMLADIRRRMLEEEDRRLLAVIGTPFRTDLFRALQRDPEEEERQRARYELVVGARIDWR